MCEHGEDFSYEKKKNRNTKPTDTLNQGVSTRRSQKASSSITYSWITRENTRTREKSQTWGMKSFAIYFATC